MQLCNFGTFAGGILQRTKLHFDPAASKLAIFQSGSSYEEKALPKHHSWAEISTQESKLFAYDIRARKLL